MEGASLPFHWLFDQNLSTANSVHVLAAIICRLRSCNWRKALDGCNTRDRDLHLIENQLIKTDAFIFAANQGSQRHRNTFFIEDKTETFFNVRNNCVNEHGANGRQAD